MRHTVGGAGAEGRLLCEALLHAVRPSVRPSGLQSPSVLSCPLWFTWGSLPWTDHPKPRCTHTGTGQPQQAAQDSLVMLPISSTGPFRESCEGSVTNTPPFSCPHLPFLWPFLWYTPFSCPAGSSSSCHCHHPQLVLYLIILLTNKNVTRFVPIFVFIIIFLNL